MAKQRSLLAAAANHVKAVQGTTAWHEKLRETHPEKMQEIDAFMDELRAALERGPHPNFHGPNDFAVWLIKEFPEISVGHQAVVDYYRRRAANAKAAR